MVNYDRQERLENPLALPNMISIVGVGGVGSWVSVFSAMAGTSELRLFDSDSIEQHNLNRLPFPETAVGKPKTEAAAALLLSLRPDVRIESYPNLTEANLSMLDGSDMVYICVDRMSVRNLVESYCEKKGLPFMHLAVEADHFSIMNTVKDVWDDGVDGYANPVAQWVVPQVFAAALGVFRVCRGLWGREYIGSLQSAFSEGTHK